ncbi:MAG TPA: hypothetical protein VFB21_17520 [Chthonomonadaceae bacterium]|nr:hypothetical protein [Chthonomonadaceae bacterium]
MGVMPENRPRRWRSIFRRYGIPAGMETENEADALDELKQKAQEALLPEGVKPPDKKAGEDSKRKRR